MRSIREVKNSVCFQRVGLLIGKNIINALLFENSNYELLLKMLVENDTMPIPKKSKLNTWFIVKILEKLSEKYRRIIEASWVHATNARPV